MASVGVLNPSNGKHSYLLFDVIWIGVKLNSFVLRSGGDGVHKRCSGVRCCGACSASVLGEAMVLLHRRGPKALQ